MAGFVEVEIYVMVDSDANHAIGTDEEAVKESYENDIGGTPAACRLVKVVLKVAVPAATVLAGTVGEEKTAGELVAAE